MRTAQNLLLTLLSALPGCQSQLAGFEEMVDPTGTARPSASTADGDSGPSATTSAAATGTADGSETDASAGSSQSATTPSSDAGAPVDLPDAGAEVPDSEAGMQPDAGDAAAQPDGGGTSTNSSASTSAAASTEPSASVASSASGIPSVSAMASATASASPPSMCPVNATYFASDDACYRIAPTRQTRPDAATTCATYGAGWHLAEAFSAQQNANIRSLNAGEELWLAASRADGGTTWRWVFSGIDFYEGKDATGDAIGGSYVNWNSDQPSGGDLELCARMLDDGTWGDVDCMVGAVDLPYGACQGPPL